MDLNDRTVGHPDPIRKNPTDVRNQEDPEGVKHRQWKVHVGPKQADGQSRFEKGPRDKEGQSFKNAPARDLNVQRCLWLARLPGRGQAGLSGSLSEQ